MKLFFQRSPESANIIKTNKSAAILCNILPLTRLMWELRLSHQQDQKASLQKCQLHFNNNQVSEILCSLGKSKTKLN